MATASALCDPNSSMASCSAFMRTHNKHVLNVCQQVVFAGNNKCCSVPKVNIGGRILQRLEELNWERKDLLAKIPDLTPQALSNLIRRDSKRSEWDEIVATALGVHVMWLVYGTVIIDAQPKRDSAHSGHEIDQSLLPSKDDKYPSVNIQRHQAQEPSFSWPFKHVDQKRYEALSETGKVAAQFAMSTAIDRAAADGLVDTSRGKRSA